MEISGVLRAPGRRGAALAAAVLTLGLATGAAAATTVAHAERQAAAADLARRADAVGAALDGTLQRYAGTMRELAARESAITAPHSAAAAPHSAVTAPHSAVTAPHSAVTAPHSAATAPHSAATAAPGSMIAAPALPGAHQVVVIAPDYAVRARLVLDGTTPPAEPRLRPGPDLIRSLDAARSSGRLVAGPPHPLPADLPLPPARRQTAFELVVPAPGGGWVVASVRVGDLMDAALHDAGVTGVTATLSTGGDATSVPVDGLAGEPWQVTVRPTGPADFHPGAAVLTAALGSVTAALAVLVLAAAHRSAAARARTERDARTAAEERADRAERDAHDRDAELTGLASAAAENLHAPLHTIAGFTELLKEEVPGLDETARGFLDRIGHSTARMLRAVDELRAYTATTDLALRPEPVDTERLALEVVADHLDSHTGARPSIEVGELPVVTADATLLRQVLAHLVDNAMRFVRHGSPAQVRITAHETGAGWWRIEVADRGIGVPAEHRTRIFAPFHRTPTAQGYAGTGLGLAVCRRIVAMHGGEIGVAANPGGGSVFHFTVSATGLMVPDEPAELTDLLG